MRKTACEEAAAILCDDFIPARHYADDRRALQEREALAKHLRAEGRKIKRYERLILAAGDPENSVLGLVEWFEHEAARIQRERKEK